MLPRVEWLEATGSTNVALRELLAREGDTLRHGTVVVTGRQTAGRGRLGRGWVTPPDTALAASVLVRGFGGPVSPAPELDTPVPELASPVPEPVEGPGHVGPVPELDTLVPEPVEGSGHFDKLNDRDAAAPLTPGWLPLLAGSAVAGTLQKYVGDGLRVGVKWPNDVHVRDEADAEAGRVGQKICGILCEMIAVPGGCTPAVIVGMGINLLVPEWELPTDRATSLLAIDGDVGGAESLADPLGEDLADRVLAGVVEELLRLVELAHTDPDAARRRVLRHSLTLGTEVRVHLPGGEVVDGRAQALADDGSLIVDLPTGGRLEVSAADVEHLR